MYHDVAQWTMVRRKVVDKGHSRRQMAKETGLSRNTIRKMLLHELPQPYKPRTPRYPALRQHTATLDAFAPLNVPTIVRYQVSINEIYRYLKREENYSGSYCAVRDYLKCRFCARQAPNQILWEHLYEEIISSSKKDAISILRSLSFNGSPLISSTRLQRLQGHLASLREHQVLCSRHARRQQDADWLARVIRTGVPPSHDSTLPSHLRVRRRERAFHTESQTPAQNQRRRTQGFNIRASARASQQLWHKPHDLDHGDLCAVLAKQGRPACAGVVRAITEAAGYKWRKARLVLTWNDSQYAEKLAHIRSILSGLGPDEAFFSIDEFGPFAVKAKPGRVLAAPGEIPQVAQWQKSKGCLIITAALELSGNQVTHFYSTKKNTTEMVRMMNLLLDRYRNRRKLYLSWDAASWHISKRLSERIEENNRAATESGGPIVDTAPLPARAQFLNVIESIFSGMARAIIHNSNYQSVAEAKAAIDRYFDERNCHFREHPRRAGKKIWGKERVPPEFAEGNNCKDPRYQ